MSHIPVMQVALDLVRKAERAGIPILSVHTHGDSDYMDIMLRTTKAADTPRLAALLHLTDRRAQPFRDGMDLEVWVGYVGPATVSMQRTILAAQAVSA